MTKGEMFLQMYDNQYGPILKIRAATFRKMFEYLISLNLDSYNILETGTVRNTDADMRKRVRDGYSTVLFGEFVSIMGGHVTSIDISPENCEISRGLCKSFPGVEIICSDSVKYLWQNYDTLHVPDLLYLDSFDLDDKNPHPSSLHHVKELLAIEILIENGCLVVVDDHVNDTIGKGTYIQEFFQDAGIEPFFKEYQIGWVYKR